MVLRVPGADGAAFEKVASDNADTIRGISDRAKGRGAIHHAFFEGDGEVVVVDEWDSAESFKAFFEDEGPNIGPLMAQLGAQPADPVFYRKLSSGDDF
jgi:heme-degrading monooxygenase HmoA